MHFFQKIFETKKTLNTYSIGLLQAKAYRALKHRTSALLKEFHISPIEWAVLGMLYDHPQGMKAAEISRTLGVRAPFITSLIDKLQNLQLVVRKDNVDDKRTKLIALTPKGLLFIPRTEKFLRKQMRPLLKGLSPKDIWIYCKTLKVIADNASSVQGNDLGFIDDYTPKPF